MEIRQLRITAPSAEDAAQHMLDKWPGWEVRVRLAAVPVINGENWFEITLIKEDT